MSRTEHLNKTIMSLCEGVIANSFLEGTFDIDSPRPYLAFEIAEVTNNDHKITYEMEVNLYDYGTVRSALDGKADELQDLLHEMVYIDDKIEFICFKNGRQPIREDDPRIIRRRLLFEIQLHDLGGN